MLRLLTISMWIVLLSSQITIGFQYDDNSISSNNRKTGDWEVELYDNTPENTKEQDGNSDLNNFNIDATEAKEKRQNDHLKHGCRCPTSSRMMTLPNGTFPQFINAKFCDTSANTDGICKFQFQCKEIIHKTLVLKKKLNMGAIARTRGEIPKKIKDDFYWDYEDIPIDCQCTM